MYNTEALDLRYDDFHVKATATVPIMLNYVFHVNWDIEQCAMMIYFLCYTWPEALDLCYDDFLWYYTWTEALDKCNDDFLWYYIWPEALDMSNDDYLFMWYFNWGWRHVQWCLFVIGLIYLRLQACAMMFICYYLNLPEVAGMYYDVYLLLS